MPGADSGGRRFYGPGAAQSYPGENMQTLAVAQEANAAWAKGAFGEDYTLEQLRAADVKAVMGGFGGSGGWPVTDGYVIPDDQYKLYEAQEGDVYTFTLDGSSNEDVEDYEWKVCSLWAARHIRE